MVDIGMLMKLKKMKETFESSHPKMGPFLKMVAETKVEEGTVIELKVTKPGEEPVVANIKLNASDLEMIQSLKGMNKQKTADKAEYKRKAKE